MASADGDLLKEFECPICTDNYEEPKVVGSCNHSFCKNCLRTYIQNAAKGGELLCPVCRQKCRVPPNGVDGLTTNFTLVNIIAKYNDVRKRLRRMMWNKCSYCNDANKNVEASLCCPQCDGISLCDDCGRKHKDHPRTESHHIMSLCGLHGRALDQFCTSCERPICVVCFGKHAEEEHHVIDYKNELKMKKDKLEEGFKKVGAATRPLKEQDTELRKVLEESKKTWEERKKNAAVNFSTIENKVEKNIRECSEKAEYHRSQWELMEQKMAEHHSRKRKLQEIQQPFLHRLHEDSKRDMNMIQKTIKDVTVMQEEIQATSNKCDVLLSEKIFKADLSENITHTYTRVMELSDSSKKDWVTPFRERMKTNDGLCEEYVASAGRFSSASLSSNLEVPDGSVVVSVTFMSKDRIAGSVLVGEGFKLLLWDLPSLAAKVIMQEEKAIISDIAALGQDHLVVLRRRSPILIVMDVVRDTKREIDVKLADEVIEVLWSVECVSHGNFLVSHGEENDHVVLLDSDGNVLQDIETGHGYRLAYCRITGMVVICTNRAHTISCYQVGENSLAKVMSVPHGVKGFECYDICSGTFGEVFIAGQMKGDKPREVRVYQLDIDTEKKTVSMKQLQVQISGEQMRSIWLPSCSVKGNQLVINSDNKVLLLQCSPRD